MTTIFLDRPLRPCWHCRWFSLMNAMGDIVCSLGHAHVETRPEKGCDGWEQGLRLDEEFLVVPPSPWDDEEQPPAGRPD